MIIRKEHINLLNKVVWAFYSPDGRLEFQELFQEAALAYCKAKRTWEPTRGKFTTYLWTCVENHLLLFLEREGRHNYMRLNGTPHTFRDDIDYRADCALNPGLAKLADLVMRLPRMFTKSHKKIIQQAHREYGWDARQTEETLEMLRESLTV